MIAHESGMRDNAISAASARATARFVTRGRLVDRSPESAVDDDRAHPHGPRGSRYWLPCRGVRQDRLAATRSRQEPGDPRHGGRLAGMVRPALAVRPPLLAGGLALGCR